MSPCSPRLASTMHVVPPLQKPLRLCEKLCHSASKKPNVWSSTTRSSPIALPARSSSSLSDSDPKAKSYQHHLAILRNKGDRHDWITGCTSRLSRAHLLQRRDAADRCEA